ncbi:hypothetical protein QR685DRAFT_544676 [Neurospora intermedia]|uniref:Uncharacterized protein n=1 Tax=Neurospora intermedia TaxID=5142 RepID=A0ABR3DEN2_NEUIN
METMDSESSLVTCSSIASIYPSRCDDQETEMCWRPFTSTSSWRGLSLTRRRSAVAANGGGLGARNTEVKYVASLEDSLAGLKLMWMDQKWFLPPTFYFTSSPPASYIKAANTSLGVIRVATEFEDVRLWGIGDEKSGVSEARIRAVCNAMKPVATLKEGPGEEDKHRLNGLHGCIPAISNGWHPLGVGHLSKSAKGFMAMLDAEFTCVDGHGMLNRPAG